MPLPPLLSVREIQERLKAIFPEGTENRNYVTREMAAKTVFVMLYAGATLAMGRWLRPDQVTRMTDAQARLTDDAARELWLKESMRPVVGDLAGRWYASNTREPIRDETLRNGLVRIGAVRERSDLPTTSPRPRYALKGRFTKLFDPALIGEALAEAIENWREDYFSHDALTRVTLRREGVVASEDRVLVKFPNGETRGMEPGPSSVISKAVVEEFVPRFLEDPGVIWLSESRNKVVARDEGLANRLGLNIQTDRNLPDLILVDLGSPEPLLVFVEIVATDGPVSETRLAALLEVATDAGFSEAQVAFVTAYSDRDDAAFKRSVGRVAWRSFVWFMSEPEHIMALHRGAGAGRSRLFQLM